MTTAAGASRVLAGKYRLEELLGEGGMGIVWAGHNLGLQTRVAIKLLQPRLAEDATAKERFLREARRAASIEGEHSVRIHDVGADEDDQPYIVMERLEGETVEARLARGNLSIATAATVMLQLLDALAEAHARGLVHRDLKPANVFLVDRPGEAVWVKVLDFGIAKLSSGASDPAGSSVTLTAPHTVVGSPQYMSPEQLRDAASVDARSDLWTCGVLLFELVSGALPFDSPSLAELLVQIVSGSPRALASTHAEGVPPAVARLIDRCLRKEPDERPQTAYELAAELAPFAHPSARALLPRIRAWCKEEPGAPARARSRGAMRGGLTLVGAAATLAFVAASWRAPAPQRPALGASIVSLEPVTLATATPAVAEAAAAVSSADAAVPSRDAASDNGPPSRVARPAPPAPPVRSATPRIQTLGDIELIP